MDIDGAISHSKASKCLIPTVLFDEPTLSDPFPRVALGFKFCLPLDDLDLDRLHGTMLLEKLLQLLT